LRQLLMAMATSASAEVKIALDSKPDLETIRLLQLGASLSEMR
jgi:hypothetical protein